MNGTELKAWMEENHYSVPALADVLGVTPETVRNYLKAEDALRAMVALALQALPPRDPAAPRVLRERRMGRTLCPSCGKPYGENRYETDRVGRNRCEECRWTMVACGECGKLKRVLTSTYLNRIGRVKQAGDGTATYTGAVFCNRVCLGRYFGRTAGFAAHPENTGGRKKSARTVSA